MKILFRYFNKIFFKKLNIQTSFSNKYWKIQSKIHCIKEFWSGDENLLVHLVWSTIISQRKTILCIQILRACLLSTRYCQDQWKHYKNIFQVTTRRHLKMVLCYCFQRSLRNRMGGNCFSFVSHVLLLIAYSHFKLHWQKQRHNFNLSIQIFGRQ